MNDFMRLIEKSYAVERDEKEGLIADSREVIIELVKKVKSGEITLEDAQKQLRKIQRNAKKNGKITRAQAYKRG